MIIVVSQISEYDGLTVRHVYEEGEPALFAGEASIVGSTTLNLRATREGDKVALTGELQATAQVDCDRCLMPVTIPVEQSFDLLYIPPLRVEDERELGEDDLAVGFYQNQVIEVDDLVREQIELALPMGRLCKQDCRGLCPHCGANLNQVECGCSAEVVDPRWEALRVLKSDE